MSKEKRIIAIRPKLRVLIKITKENIDKAKGAHISAYDMPRRALFLAIYDTTGIRIGVRAGYLMDTRPSVKFLQYRKFKLPPDVYEFLASPADLQPINFILEEL